MDFDLNEQLKIYYDKTFPFQLIHKWLNYSHGKFSQDVKVYRYPNFLLTSSFSSHHSDGKDNFKFREFSLTLPGDIYVRYQSYDRAEDLRAALCHRVPIKIDVGAVYNMNPKLARAYPNDFKPLQHELVFDIDISDYDDVRTCCKESSICRECWPFMKIGAKILYTILTKEFGFKHMLFVFSGRRGFHCWVCDKAARELGSDARKAIVDYFSVVVGGLSMVKRVVLPNNHAIHPMIAKSLHVIDEDFEDLMINKQDFLANDHLVQNVIDLCEDKELKMRLDQNCKINRCSSSQDCWNKMIAQCQQYKPRRGKANYFLHEVKLQHCFPRLDANVTRGLNHLLKLPFCVHPKTGNICVPIDIHDIDNFDIFKVPNLKTLSRDSMHSYVNILKKFVETMEREDK